MPRISGRSSLTTTSWTRLRPSERSVCRWFCLLPIPDRVCVIVSRAIASSRLHCASTQQAGRGDVLERQAATRRDLFGADEVLQRRHGRVDDVDRVVRAERLGQHVVDARALEHGAHRAAGDDARTGTGRLEQHHAGRCLALHGVWDRLLDARDLEEVLLGLLDTLRDRGRHLLGLAVADADRAVTVADDDEGGEAEPAATLDHLGDAVDGDEPLDVRALLRRATASAVTAVGAVAAASLAASLVAARSGSALRSGHQTFLSISSDRATVGGVRPRDVAQSVRLLIQNSSPASRAASANAATRPV